MLGFTTKSFASSLERGTETLEALLEWAVDCGFGWIEIRDGGAKLDDGDLRKLDARASESNIAVQYAWDGSNLLGESDEALFAKGLQKASQFRTARYARITIAGEAFKTDRMKRGYSRAEFQHISRRITENARLARSFGITPVYENSHEPLSGDGESFFGIAELLDGTETMRLTFDPANFLHLKPPLQAPNWSALSEFYSRYSSRIPYVHLKSAGVDGFLPTLEIQDEQERACIQYMWREKKLLCIELPECADAETGKKNILAAQHKVLHMKD